MKNARIIGVLCISMFWLNEGLICHVKLQFCVRIIHHCVHFLSGMVGISCTVVDCILFVQLLVGLSVGLIGHFGHFTLDFILCFCVSVLACTCLWMHACVYLCVCVCVCMSVCFRIVLVQCYAFSKVCIKGKKERNAKHGE